MSKKNVMKPLNFDSNYFLKKIPLINIKNKSKTTVHKNSLGEFNRGLSFDELL